MTPVRFFYEGPLGVGQSVSLPKAQAHHALRVLRLTPGAPVVLFNGLTGEYAGELLTSKGQQVQVQVHRFQDPQRESPLHLGLAQCLGTGDKMDWVFQKAVELGVRHCVPLQGARSVVRLTGERAQARQAHWQRVVIAACEQCGRNELPRVAPIQSLDHWLSTMPKPVQGVLLSPQAPHGAMALPPPAQGVFWILVGPEGGWTKQETQGAEAAGFTPARLGPRVLRTETAALALMAALQGRWGDFA